MKIGGEGEKLAEYKLLAKQLNIEKNVQFLGQIPHENVPQILNSFTIFAALSRYESFGVAVLEAAACGIPAIVSDAEGLKEIVLDGRTGIIVLKEDEEAAASAMIELIENKRRIHILGTAAR